MTTEGEALAPGVRVEEFEIGQQAGSGGFGVTYVALDVMLGRRVAVKEYLPWECGSRRADGGVGPRSAAHAKDYGWGLSRFLEEARALARFDHPNVVRVYRVFEALGTAYLVTEYVEGPEGQAWSLADEMESAGPLSESRVRGLVEALSSGLSEVHDAGLTHCDIKPANVMLRADRSPVLIDFGAARQALSHHSRSVTSVVSPGYAPIEQYGTNSRQGPWTDVYALGAVAYEALSGRVPYEAPDRTGEDPLPPLSAVAAGRVSVAFASAVDSALSFRGEDRPRDLAAWLGMWSGAPSVPVAGGGRRDAGGDAVGSGLPGEVPSPSGAEATVPPRVVLPSPGDAEAAGSPPGEAPSRSDAEALGLLGGGVPEPGPSRWRVPGVAAAVLLLVAAGVAGWRVVGGSGDAGVSDCDVCPELVVIPAGEFMMGSPASEEGRRSYEGPRHQVEIGSPFAVGVYEVTFAEWDACVSEGGCGGYRPDDLGAGRGRRPVQYVSWDDARRYVSWLSEFTGFEYRLLSESEWEYVARAGTSTRYWWGDSVGRNRANCWDCGSRWGRMQQLAPVGSFAANGFGVHDMLGNAWEWVEDCWHDDYRGAPSDGGARTSGGRCSDRVMRGGGYHNAARELRSANRNRGRRWTRDGGPGFRVARALTALDWENRLPTVPPPSRLESSTGQ